MSNINSNKCKKSHLNLKGATAAIRGDSLPAGHVFVTLTWDFAAIIPLSPSPRAWIFIRCFWMPADVSQMMFPLVGFRRAWPDSTSLSRLLNWWCPDLQFLLECLSMSLNPSWGNEPLRRSRVFLNWIVSFLSTRGLLWAERGANGGLLVPPDVPWALSEDWFLNPVPLSNSFETEREDTDEVEEDNTDVRPPWWLWAAGPSKPPLKLLVSCLERVVRLRGRGIPELLWDIVFMFTLALIVEENHHMKLCEDTDQINKIICLLSKSTY